MQLDGLLRPLNKQPMMQSGEGATMMTVAADLDAHHHQTAGPNSCDVSGSKLPRFATHSACSISGGYLIAGPNLKRPSPQYTVSTICMTDTTEHPGPSKVSLNTHAQRRPDQNITFYTDGDDVFVLFVAEPPTKGLFKVVGETINPRVLVRYDDAIVEGKMVTPYYQDDLRRVRTSHVMVGLMHKFPIDEMLDEPALLLERIPHPGNEDLA